MLSIPSFGGRDNVNFVNKNQSNLYLRLNEEIEYDEKVTVTPK